MATLILEMELDYLTLSGILKKFLEVIGKIKGSFLKNINSEQVRA